MKMLKLLEVMLTGVEKKSIIQKKMYSIES